MTEFRRLWGAPSGTPEGDRLDRLATLIDAYEAVHNPVDPPAAPDVTPPRRPGHG